MNPGLEFPFRRVYAVDDHLLVELPLEVWGDV